MVQGKTTHARLKYHTRKEKRTIHRLTTQMFAFSYGHIEGKSDGRLQNILLHFACLDI